MIHLPTLKQLRHYAALAEKGNFGRAAEMAGVTQSTLSASIQELEAILGAPLVDRGKRGVVFTPLGERVLERAKSLLADAEELAREASAARAPLTGELRLGVIPTVSPFLLPRVLPRLRKAHPKLKLFLVEDQTERLIERLRDGAIDCALLALPYDTGPVDSASIGADVFRLVVPKAHPLAKAKRVSPAMVRGEPLLLLEDGHCLTDHALSACGIKSARPRDAFAATSLFTLVQMVANGLGVTLLPDLALDAGILRGTDLVAVPVDGDPSRELGLVWRKGTARAAEFRLLAQAIARDSRSGATRV
ncbi:MAG: LysR family transcriptional regulator [Proteobacteria bacterium]|nr:LysR family transcriptional regulator [Pseudomonadota bacterium]